MNNTRPEWENLQLRELSTPCFVIHASLLENNLAILRDVADKSGATILHALKAFALPAVFPLMARYLDGICASGLHEARLGKTRFKKAVHCYGPAYAQNEFSQILKYCDHVIFNSPGQLNAFLPQILRAKKNKSFGMRINPEHSETENPLYDPCRARSRLGTIASEFDPQAIPYLDGLHFHTLCEKDSHALERTLAEVEKKFGQYFSRLKWINFGGGHWITKPDYDREHLVSIIKSFIKRHGLQVILEPGEASVIHTGILVSTVLDAFQSNGGIAVLDASIPAHMPDVLEMPYRPAVWDETADGKFSYSLGGPSCLAGDEAGIYRFDKPLRTGDPVVFDDMSQYTFVKTNTFNGVKLPGIYLHDGKKTTLVKRFGYNDFAARLG